LESLPLVSNNKSGAKNDNGHLVKEPPFDYLLSTFKTKHLIPKTIFTLLACEWNRSKHVVKKRLCWGGYFVPDRRAGERQKARHREACKKLEKEITKALTQEEFWVFQ